VLPLFPSTAATDTLAATAESRWQAWRSAELLLDSVGVDYVQGIGGAGHVGFYADMTAEAVDISSFDTMLSGVNVFGPQVQAIAPYAVALDGNVLELRDATSDRALARFDLGAWLVDHRQQLGRDWRSHDLELADRSITVETSELRAVLAIGNLNATLARGGDAGDTVRADEYTVESIMGTIYLQRTAEP